MSNIKIFESSQVRSQWSEAEGKWCFSVQDVVKILTNSSDVKQYIKRMLDRDEQLRLNWGTICTPVEMIAKGWVQFVPTLTIETAGGKHSSSSFRICNSEILNISICNAKKNEIGKRITNPYTQYCRITNSTERVGFVKNKQAARQGGKIAGDARKALELKTGEKVVSANNYLPEKKQTKSLKK
jgi:hypothetical protein